MSKAYAKQYIARQQSRNRPLNHVSNNPQQKAMEKAIAAGKSVVIMKKLEKE